MSIGIGAGERTELCGIELEHPVINASGTFDALAARRAFGDEAWERFPFSAFVSKTITLESRAGNPPPRLFEAAAGMVNSIGLPNKGLEGFASSDLRELGELPVPLIVSVMATSREAFGELVGTLADRDEVAGFELNISCPNVKSGLIVGAEPGETEALVAALRPLSAKPLVVKLTPNVADPAPIAAAAERGGADAISLINTIAAAPWSAGSGAEPWLGAGSGGLSGPSVREVALHAVRRVAAAVDLPIVGMGGIESGRHAADLISAGAGVVAVGTASFRDPVAGTRVREELRRLVDVSRTSGSPQS